MKKRINLLRKKKHFSRFVSIAHNIKQYGTLFGIVFFVLFVFVVFQTIVLHNESGDLIKKKQLYLSLLAEQKDIEANTRFFKGKLTQMGKFEADDARFVPYYNVLLNAIGSSSQSAVLDTVDIDKNRKTSFVVKFKDYEGMISFLKYVESDLFLKNFDELSMASLNLSREIASTNRVNTQLNKSYQLQFQGKFKLINDATL